MNTEKVMRLARANLGNGAAMDSSARLCFADAVELFDAGNPDDARRRAIKALAYSVGILSPTYIAASA